MEKEKSDNSYLKIKEYELSTTDIKSGEYSTVYRAWEKNPDYTAVEVVDPTIHPLIKLQILGKWEWKRIDALPGDSENLSTFCRVHEDPFERIKPVKL